jgi:excisionase family DNA binding protein
MVGSNHGYPKAPAEVATDLLATVLTQPIGIDEAARRTGAHTNTIRRAIRSKALPAVYVARRWRIRPADLDAWAAGAR